MQTRLEMGPCVLAISDFIIETLYLFIAYAIEAFLIMSIKHV